jgi:hypothetical protein
VHQRHKSQQESGGAKPNFLPRCFDTHPRVRFSVGENRMKLANATNTNRKFGKPRDLQCPGSRTEVSVPLVLPRTRHPERL